MRRFGVFGVSYIRFRFVQCGDQRLFARLAETVVKFRERDLFRQSFYECGDRADRHDLFQTANENKVWIIGYNVDNKELFPDTYLTAPVWNWEHFYEPRILECLQGKFRGVHYWEGVETGIVDLAPFTENVKTGTAEKVDEAREKLMNGTFDVFYGPITDNEGNIRVKEGQSMTDEAMLNDMFWYVEGVVTDEAE